MQFCEACQGYKAPRAHHCRKCSRCVMKMDHHCPWINNCVGHFNHGHFLAFLTFAVLGCAQASFVLAMTLYYGLNRVRFNLKVSRIKTVENPFPVLVPLLRNWRRAQNYLNFDHTLGCDVCPGFGYWRCASSWCFALLSTKISLEEPNRH